MEASMVEIGGRNPPLPPNVVSLRQLREEEQTQVQPQKHLLDRSSTEEKPDNRPLPLLPPNYVSLRQLRERRLKEEQEKEKEKGKEKEKETDNCGRVPPNYVSLKQLQEWRLKEEKEKENGREEESENHPRLPPNYVSLRQLQEQRLKEEKEKEKDEVREKMKEKGEKHPLLPPNYISLRQLRELRLQEKEEKEAKEEAPEATIQQTKVQKEACNLAKNLQSNGEMKFNKKKKKKKHGRKKFSGKDNGEPVQGLELVTEVTDFKIGEAVNASSSAAKEVPLYQNENNTVKKVKGGEVNLTESISQTIPVLVRKKRFNGAQSMGFKMLNGRDKGKGKEVNLSEQNHIVVPLSEVAKGSDEVEEVIGSKIENVEQKGDQTPCHEEVKGVLGAGEVIGSEIWNGKEEKGMGKNVNLPESSKWGGRTGGYWRKRNQAAGIRGKGHPKAGGFPARPAEHLRGGGNLVWVPKKSS